MEIPTRPLTLTSVVFFCRQAVKGHPRVQPPSNFSGKTLKTTSLKSAAFVLWVQRSRKLWQAESSHPRPRGAGWDKAARSTHPAPPEVGGETAERCWEPEKKQTGGTDSKRAETMVAAATLRCPVCQDPVPCQHQNGHFGERQEHPMPRVQITWSKGAGLWC